MTRAWWVGVDLAILLAGMTAYVVAVLLKCRPRYVIPFVAAATLLIAGAIFLRDYEITSLSAVGLGFDHFEEALLWLGPATLLFGAALVVYGRWSGRMLWNRRFLLVLPVYLVWGFVQQWVFQCILNRRLQELVDSAWAVPLVVGVVFSAVHVPRWWLVGLTLIVGPVWAAVYYAMPNLYVLALSHAFLGGLAYFCVSGEDPLTDL